MPDQLLVGNDTLFSFYKGVEHAALTEKHALPEWSSERQSIWWGRSTAPPTTFIDQSQLKGVPFETHRKPVRSECL